MRVSPTSVACEKKENEYTTSNKNITGDSELQSTVDAK
jgi:hypothetical protein